MPTYNRAARLSDMLRVLLGYGEADEVVVINDGSTDDTERVLRALSAEHPVLTYRTVANGGASRARQLAVEMASSDVVVIIDDDVTLERGTVRGHAQRHAGEAGLVVVGSMPTPEPEQLNAQSVGTLLYARDYRRHCRNWAVDAETILRSLWMGNISLRRADALAVGLASPHVLGYHEDRDFGLRCRRAGYRAVFEPSLGARHDHGRDLAGFRRDARAQGSSSYDLHAAHADLLGAGPDYKSKVSGPGRLLVRAANIPLVGHVSAAVAALSIRVCAVLPSPHRLTAAARLLQHIEAQRGYAARRRTK